MQHSNDHTAFKNAIPTVYNGVQFKSRMEAQCAFLFDQLGWEWKYEPESLMLSNGVTYIPDFSLNGGALMVECRGYETKRGAGQIAGFIKDLTARSIAKDEYCSYLVMGPDACTVFHSDMAKIDEYPARVTYCPRCEAWSLHSFRNQWHGLCPCCVELTFNDYPLTVEKGKFFIGTRPLDEAAGIFDRNIQRTGWAVSFQEHVFESLGRHWPSEEDQEALGAILARLFRSNSEHEAEEDQ